MSDTSQATFNKLQVPTDSSEKALQNPVNSVPLFNIKKYLDWDQQDSWYFCIFISEVAYTAEALC
jgi:hypothetical protein